MSPKPAQIIFVGFNLLACLGVGYLVFDIYRVEQAIAKQEEIVFYDSGISFLLLSSVFWALSLIQYLGLRKSENTIYRHASVFLVGWFVASLAIAYSISIVQKSRLEEASYLACDAPESLSRVSRGKSLIYIKSEESDTNSELTACSVSGEQKHWTN
ncbi:MAG: hypothetical protein CML20_04180 [Rheinheimera sp.]|uniref:hypothetical protein n=1 Tax=Arsukibacterium sp. UBA3155 TaxID=1946058 RepID=UPI000C991FD2|nr:hypothetical protein [Arsukibacterium sp. UBA3155]MAD73987.1 hypothetical protein [Rheinheimera sp.]|tara:strand:+ start:41246 stop:41716 length:471 start_codon:yes stop_codon:yes gene_type:complete